MHRSDAIFYKPSNGELTVGLANKLAIESRGKFQAEVLKERADIRPEEVQQQRAAEAMLQTSTQMAASQPRPGAATRDNGELRVVWQLLELQRSSLT